MLADFVDIQACCAGEAADMEALIFDSGARYRDSTYRSAQTYSPCCPFVVR